MNNKEMRISKEELELLKNTFQGDELLKELRKYFFVKGAKPPKEITESVMKVVKTLIFPEIDLDTPVGQQVDLFLTLPIDNIDEEERKRLISIRVKLIDYLKFKFNLGGEEFDINKLDTDTINLRARNTYIMHIESQLVQIKTLANLPAQIDLKKNSAK